MNIVYVCILYTDISGVHKIITHKYITKTYLFNTGVSQTSFIFIYIYKTIYFQNPYTLIFLPLVVSVTNI